MQRILIADDEPHIIRIMKLSLERAGFQVDSRGNGEEALTKIREDQPDILITDIEMPRMDGEELCKRVRDEFPQHIKIFVLTSRTEMEHREWARSLPNLSFLEKPVSVRKLLKMIEANSGNGDLMKQDI